MKILLPVAAAIPTLAAMCCCCPGLDEILSQQMGGGGFGGGGFGGGDGRTLYSIAAGEHVTVLEIHSEDAYYADRSSIQGKSCTTQEYTSYKDGGWHGGSVICTDGSDYYFYKAALRDDGPDYSWGGAAGGSGVAASVPAGVLASEVPPGTRVKIVDVSPEDAYYSDKATIVGKHCTTDETTSLKDGGWHGGSMHCTDGSTYYFYKAQLAAD